MVHIWRLHPPAMKEEEGTGWAVLEVNISDEVPHVKGATNSIKKKQFAKDLNSL